MQNLDTVTISNILSELKKHGATEFDLEKVKKAYKLAVEIHQGQFRQSGEPYIIHPLNVAQNVIKMEVYDADTICGALLHDTIEDAKISFTKEDIKDQINEVVAELVDGVTKLKNMDSKAQQTSYNIRKLILGLLKDIRIIVIKLADRIHNMETLQFKPSEEKRKAIAQETMDLFVPIADNIGEYRVKSQLEDLSLKYIDPEGYQEVKEQKDALEESELPYLREMLLRLSDELLDSGIEHTIEIRRKNVWTAYDKMKHYNYKVEDIYDLTYLKILVDTIKECYETICVIHQCYKPINGRFRDYLFSPRNNLYQALHTSVSGPYNITKVKVRTSDLDHIAGYGIPAQWSLTGPYHRTIEETQKDILENNQMAKKIVDINQRCEDDSQFVEQTRQDALSEQVHVYVLPDTTGYIEVPKNATITEFLAHYYPDTLDKNVAVTVNGAPVSYDYQLKTNDCINISPSKKSENVVKFKS